MRFIYISLLLLFLSSCESSPSCIKADDFGEPTLPFEVNGGSRGTKLKYPDNPEMRWYEDTWATGTGYVLTGTDDLRATVIGAWSPWQYGFDTDGYDDNGDPVLNWCDRSEFPVSTDNMGMETERTEVNLEPCFFIEGVGFYIGIGENQDNGLVNYYHFAAPDYFSQNEAGWHFTLSLSDINDFKDTLGDVDYENIRVYIKVVHYSYDANISGCLAKDDNGRDIFDTTNQNFAVFECSSSPEIRFTSGVRAEKSGFLQYMVNLIMDPFESIVEGMYKGILGNDFFRRIIPLISTFLISYLATIYFLGLADFSRKELMSMILKLGIVYMFLDPNKGWYFYQYFVAFFWEGMQELANFVNNSINIGASKIGGSIQSYNSRLDSSIVAPLDDILESFASNAVQRKMLALPFSHPLGIVFYLGILLAMFFLFIVFIETTVYIIIIFITMLLVLSLGPIFFLALILPYTKKYFDNWLKVLVSAMIQPLIFMAFITLFATVIWDYIKRLLYFESCFTVILPLIFFDIGFWSNKGHDVKVYNDDTGSFENGSLDEILDFGNLFSLFLFAYLMKYVMEKVPQITDKLADGLNFSSMGGALIKMTPLHTARDAAISGTGKAVKHFVGKPIRNLGITLAGKTSLATFVKGTEAYDLRKAKEELRNDYLSKGFTKAEAEKFLNKPDSGRNVGSDKLQERFMQKRAESKLKYGTGKLLSVKSIPGVNALNRIKNDGISGNFQRAYKAVTDEYTKGSLTSSGNYAKWRNQRAQQKKRKGSQYHYDQLKLNSPAYRKQLEKRSFKRKNTEVFNEAMQKKFEADAKEAAKAIKLQEKYNKESEEQKKYKILEGVKGMSELEIYDNLNSSSALAAETRRRNKEIEDFMKKDAIRGHRKSKEQIEQMTIEKFGTLKYDVETVKNDKEFIAERQKKAKEIHDYKREFMTQNMENRGYARDKAEKASEVFFAKAETKYKKKKKKN